MDIFESLKRFRKDFKLTQDDIARVLGISKQAYGRYEKDVIPSAQSIKKIAVNFKVSTDYLLGLTDKPINDINIEIAHGIEILYQLVKSRAQQLKKI